MGNRLVLNIDVQVRKAEFEGNKIHFFGFLDRRDKEIIVTDERKK